MNQERCQIVDFTKISFLKYNFKFTKAQQSENKKKIRGKKIPREKIPFRS